MHTPRDPDDPASNMNATMLIETIKLNNKTRVSPCIQCTTDMAFVVDCHNDAYIPSEHKQNQ